MLPLLFGIFPPSEPLIVLADRVPAVVIMSVRVISSLSVPATRVYVASSFISEQVKTMLA